MKKFKKLSALLLAAVMILTMAVPAMALDGTEKATVTIDNVDKDSTVKFYQVVEPTFSEGNLTGYSLKSGLVDPEEEITVTYTSGSDTLTKKMKASDLATDGVLASPVNVGGVQYTFTDHVGDLVYNMTGPTQEQINKAVSMGLLGTAKHTATADENNRVQQLVTAGQYIAIITPTNSDSTYNPVVVSAGYKGQQVYKVADTQADPPEAGTHYKKLDGTFTDVAPTAATKHLYEAEAWDATTDPANPQAAAPRWIAVGTTTTDTLIAKNLDADSNYTYIEGTTALAKKQNPDVQKGAETDHPEQNVQVAVVATDDKGDCKLNNGNLVYVKAPFTAAQHNNTKNGTEFYKQDATTGEVTVWVDGTDDPTAKLALSAMETGDAHLATTVADTAYSASQGEEVRYTVTPTIPQYPANAKNKTLSFTDKLGTGLDFVPGSIDIYCDSATTPIIKQYNSETKEYLFLRAAATGETGTYLNDNGTYRLVDTAAATPEIGTHVLVAKAKENPTGGNTFQINFDYDAIPGAEGAKEIKKITYKAVINDEAVQGIPGNVNVVKMHYSNSTGEGNTWEIDRFEEPSGEGITEQHDEGRAYTYEIRFIKTNDKDEYVKEDNADNATHVRIPDTPVATWPERVKEEYAELLKRAEKGYMANGTEHLYVTVADFNNFANTYVIFPLDINELDKEHVKRNPEYETLAGAVFGLYDSNGVLICEITTDANGVGHTTNVSAGTYTLKEHVPPVGYTKTNETATVVANWTKASTWSTHSATRYVYTATITEAHDYNASNNPQAVQVGWLIGTGTNVPFYDLNGVTEYNATEHTAKVDGVLVKNVFPAYLKDTVTTSSETSNVVYNNNGGTVQIPRFNNTKSPELPSTGGMGTYLFTIAGIAIMGVAAFMLIFKRRRA